MTKGELIEEVAQHAPRFSRQAIAGLVNAVFGALADALARGERIDLRGFGSFCVKERPARHVHNPRHGGSSAIPAKRLPVFKVGKELRQRVKGPQEPGSSRPGPGLR